MPANVKFDDAIPVLGDMLVDQLGLEIGRDGYFLRDGFGRVAYYAHKPLSQKQVRAFNRAAIQRLGRIAFPAGPLQIVDDAVPPLAAVLKTYDSGGNRVSVRVVDRRLIGRDWLTRPAAPMSGLPPMLTFGSLKGGVGRTTALFVLAMFLARQGKNVLLVDLDLEAPGLSSLLFNPFEGPAYGALEYLVEAGLNGVPDDELHLYVGTSTLTDRLGARGRVDLLPATGEVTYAVPETMLSKLARALVERPSPDGPVPLSAQIREMVARVGKRGDYDAILVDARAGLAELTAGPLLGLGSNVLLFGTDHPHTFEGYRYLTAHMGLLAPQNDEPEWRDRIHFVHAKAVARSDRLRAFNDRLYDVLAETMFDEPSSDGDEFGYSMDDEQSPHQAWVIYHDSQFLSADYVADPAMFDSPIVTAVFSDLFRKAAAILGMDEVCLDLPQ